MKWTGAFAKMDWRIRQNGPAYARYTIHVYIFEWAGGFCGVGPGGPSPRERVPSRKSPQPARIYTHVWCIMHALVHFGECANPIWQMRQSILSNAPIYFGECTTEKLPLVGSGASFIDLCLATRNEKLPYTYIAVLKK